MVSFVKSPNVYDVYSCYSRGVPYIHTIRVYFPCMEFERFYERFIFLKFCNAWVWRKNTQNSLGCKSKCDYTPTQSAETSHQQSVPGRRSACYGLGRLGEGGGGGGEGAGERECEAREKGI